MKVLLIKTSSLGDVIHTLPALSDAALAIADLQIDWVVEEAFAEIPGWHPAVSRVIPVALRRWRGQLWGAIYRREWQRFQGELRARVYDRVLDAQGLLKSALLTRLARGPRHGLDRISLREPLARLAYQHHHQVPRGQHAVNRLRQLFARALDYPEPRGDADFGLDRHRFAAFGGAPGVVFLHGTSWPSKHYPEERWVRLGKLANRAGYCVYLPRANVVESDRATRLAAQLANAQVLPAGSLTELAGWLAGACGVIGVDTGPAQLAAALGVPAVTLFGSTSPELTGPPGATQTHLQARRDCAPCLRRECLYAPAGRDPWPPCYATLEPEQVWSTLQLQLSAGDVATP